VSPVCLQISLQDVPAFRRAATWASIGGGDSRSTEALTLRACVAQACLNALLNQRTLKLRHGADHVEPEASRQRENH
jgi:hypothetical protein